MHDLIKKKIHDAASVILEAKQITAFTGAGISVESGIPPFRGKDGLWNKYNPSFLDIDFFYSNPKESWRLIKEIFYDFFGKANPNNAHKALAWMEQNNLLHGIITQNIDNLHQEAGSKIVHEYHGTSHTLVCIECEKSHQVTEVNFNKMPPACNFCQNGILKPDFIFFGEGIPETAQKNSIKAAEESDVFLVIGTTGEIMPASMIPQLAKSRGAHIIEVNTHPSNYTGRITDIFLEGKAGYIMNELTEVLKKEINY